MGKFIEVTVYDKKTLVNVNSIRYISCNASSKVFIVIPDKTLEVKESYDEVKSLLNPVLESKFGVELKEK